MAFFLGVWLILPAGCTEHEPIRLGFIGELTTRAAGLSTNARDGFLMAIEEINNRGGINGRTVEGVVIDTRSHKDSAVQATRALIARGVSAIVGPMTSQTAVAIVPEINNAQIPLISPTVSTNQLSGRQDYFFRAYYTNAQAAQLLAEKILDQTGIRRLTVLYDLGNRAYTEDWIEYFQDVFEQNDKAQISRIPFEYNSETLFIDLAKKALTTDPQGILILANAIDTAMICQQMAKTGIDLPRYATGWSYSDDLIQFGGKSVEGLKIIQSADLEDPAPEMRSFVTSFQKRFGSVPNFPAVHAYDATTILLKVLHQTTDSQKIQTQLMATADVRGLQSNLAFDRYGDLKHPQLYLAQIKNGHFTSRKLP